MRALLLGNSPALIHPSIDLSLIDRDTTTVFGANRLWFPTPTDPRWPDCDNLQLILPDWLGTVDVTIEPEWFPPQGELQGIITTRCTWEADGLTPCPFPGRTDVIATDTQAMKGCSQQWPDPGDPYFEASSSPAHVAQFLLQFSPAFTSIGILGIDYTAPDLMRQAHLQGGQAAGIIPKTHWYGNNPGCGGGPKMKRGQEVSYQFWTRFRVRCGELGIGLRNLSPCHNAPFQLAHIAKEPFKDWCAG